LRSSLCCLLAFLWEILRFLNLSLLIFPLWYWRVICVRECRFAPCLVMECMLVCRQCGETAELEGREPIVNTPLHLTRHA
jgi:hypothetical protein